LLIFVAYYCISQRALNYIRNKREKQKVSKDKQLAMSNGSIRAQHEVYVDHNLPVSTLVRYGRQSPSVDPVPWDFLVSVERNSERECRHVHTFFGRKAVQCFCYHIHNGTDLTDQTSCFDRKLCALIGAVKPAIFAPLEPEGET
ncbi:hypothetical protein T4B_14481, partial [Trichinella pseudospiralis]